MSVRTFLPSPEPFNYILHGNENNLCWPIIICVLNKFAYLMIKKFQRWFRWPFTYLRDHSVAASGVLMIKNNIGGLL